MSTPRIMFDDGSRIIMEDSTTMAAKASEGDEPSKTTTSIRDNVPIEIYYEVNRVAHEVVNKLDWSINTLRGQLIQQVSNSSLGGAAEDADEKIITTDNEEVNTTKRNLKVEDDDGFICRIALQFPDELLCNAPDVSWLMEDAIAKAYSAKFEQSNIIVANDDTTTSNEKQLEQEQIIEQHLQQPPLVFILGDTTYGSCCPDEISANHLNANVIVHYGYACLSPTECIPVVYAFGVSSSSVGSSPGVWKECVDLVVSNTEKQIEDGETASENEKQKLLILYEVKYHHAMKELQLEFDTVNTNHEKNKFEEIVLGMIPKQQLNSKVVVGGGSVGTMQNQGCCGSASDSKGQVCCSSSTEDGPGCSRQDIVVQSTTHSLCCDAKDTTSPTSNKDTSDHQESLQQYIPRTIGGLEIPNDIDLTQYTLLYIGDDLNIDSSNNNDKRKNSHTRLLHVLLRCGAPDGPKSIWSYSPIHRRLITDVLNSPLSPTNDTTLSTVISRTLRRRYFLLNKAKLANTIAILIGTTSNSYSFRRLLKRTRHRIQSTGRTAYTFAVGKLSTSPHKLANFAEIDAFVLIACGESIANFWQMEREEMLVPVLTPLELDVALGYREWDGRYSCDFGDLIRWDEVDGIVQEEEGYDNDVFQHVKEVDNIIGSDDEEDEPFFSMISGKYEQSRASTSKNTSSDLEALPGQGKLIEYRSEAAEFLKKREYRGLEANVGETEVKAAVLGMVGIASNYGEKLSKDDS